MKNKKGFTLVELLAVIAILAILVIIALPNVLSMFNSAKKTAFETEAREVYRQAEQSYILKNDSEYSNVSSLGLPELSLTGRKNLQYYVKINPQGHVEAIKVTDGVYQYENNSMPSIDDISTNQIEEVSAATNKVKIEKVINYTVTFYNYDGSLLENKTVASGTTATPSTIPTKDEGNYTYAFSKWVTSKGGSTEANLTNISSDMSVYASFGTSKLKIFYINGERCTFIDKVGGTESSTWGYYIDFCSNPEGYGGSSVGSCPKNNALKRNNAKMYLNNTTNYLYDSSYSTLSATTVIYAGRQYGDDNYISEYNSSNCFVAGTKVSTEKGLVNIESIKVGDKVWSYNEDNNKVELSTVKNTHVSLSNNIYEVIIGNETIYVTSMHPFYVENKGWVKVKDLSVNDKITSYQNNMTVNVKSIKHTTLNTNVYNMTVDNNHTYFVGENKYLVHNKPS